MTVKLDSEIASFFPDPDASSAVILAANHITAPMILGKPITAGEMSMGGGVRVVFLVIDGSPSMSDVASLLITGFNDYYVPALMDARNDDTGALRIGGVVFSSDITPLWEGRDAQGRPNFFHALDQLPRLSPREYDPSRGYGTALHRAIQDGTARAIKYAAQIQAETGIDVDVDIVILTDGGNTDPPRDPKDTRMMIQGSDRSRVRHVFLYYQTVAGASDPSNYAVNELGIDPEQVQSFMAKPGETREQQAVRFRRLMQVMSSVTAGRNTSAVMAAALTDDTELV